VIVECFDTLEGRASPFSVELVGQRMVAIDSVQPGLASLGVMCKGGLCEFLKVSLLHELMLKERLFSAIRVRTP
jgi:hypothetical protein